MTTLATSARNAACNGTVDLLDAGSGAGKIRIRAGSTTLCDIVLLDPAFGNAGATVAGRADCNGLPLSGTAIASGTPDNYLALDSDGNTHFSGTCGTSGAEAIIDTATIAAGQIVTLLGLTLTQPAS